MEKMGPKQASQSQKRTQLKSQIKSQSQDDDPAGVPGASIKWTAHLGTLLAYKLKDEYNTKYVCGTRIAVAKQWAIDLRIGHLDPKGAKTKAAVAVLLWKYREARALYNQTGSGDVEEVKIVNGREVTVVKTLLEQCKELCPHWEILFGHLSSIDEEAAAAGGLGLTQRGLKGPLNCGTNNNTQGDSQEEEPPEIEPLEVESPEVDDDVTEDKEGEESYQEQIYRPGTQTRVPQTPLTGSQMRGLGSTDDITFRASTASPTIVMISGSRSRGSQGNSQFSTASSNTVTEETQPYAWEHTPERTLSPKRSTQAAQKAGESQPSHSESQPSQSESQPSQTTLEGGHPHGTQGQIKVNDTTNASKEPNGGEWVYLGIHGRQSRQGSSVTELRYICNLIAPYHIITDQSLACYAISPDCWTYRAPYNASVNSETEVIWGGGGDSSPTVTPDDQLLFVSDDGGEDYEDTEKEKPPARLVKQEAKLGDIAGIIERKARLQPRKKLSKMDEELDLKMQILKARDRRLAVKEMKYRYQAGEKSSEQRQHELAVLELKYKCEQAKAQQEAHRLQMLQMKFQQGDGEGNDGQAIDVRYPGMAGGAGVGGGGGVA